MNTSATNIDEVLATFDESWAPRLLATVEGRSVKLARLDGTFVWHTHEDTDELFLVLSGTIEIGIRDDGNTHFVRLGPKDVYVVPRGVEHRPSADAEAVVLLIERAGTLSTGDFAGETPDHITSTRGISAGL
ncbi:cupin domain-containing protein [Pseudonocardia tropica]|uniref:Cupin domain-containing protein n=1 Tax=Pseudonocardia tropica TaxID=681289 RepID=A0ABV1JXS2_9PSEU